MKRYVCPIAVIAVMLAILSSCAAGAGPVSAAPGLDSGVKTDWSKLAPYAPPEEVYTRLSEGPMPEPAPSVGYGLLLPYVGARVDVSGGYYGDGNRYGFVTTDGAIVTDPSYLMIDLADNGQKPVYRLVKAPENDTEKGWHRADTYGVCAHDGSWATPCIYRGVLCLDSVILLIRDGRTNDADAIDYDGRFLYRVKDMPYFNRLLPGMFEEFLFSFGDGFLTIPLDDGSTILIDQRTGQRADTGFAYTGAFSEGLAPVSEKNDGTSPFGYIDRSFNLVIEPRFFRPGSFMDGKAVVCDENGDFLIIDQKGAELFRAGDEIMRPGPGLFLVNGENEKRWLGADLQELAFRPGFEGKVTAPDGWYSYHAGGSTILSDYENEYVYQGLLRIVAVTGGFVEFEDESHCGGVMRLDGTVIFKTDNRETRIRPIEAKSGLFFAVNRPDAITPSYALYDSEGRAVLEGRGAIRYDALSGLYQISAPDFFGWCDASGNFVFKISLLQFQPD